jgi:NtrC-family two-component system response regulator AlgB
VETDSGMAFNILVVDDEPQVQHILQSYLQLRGFTVMTASDPEAALSLMSKEHYHVVLADINLPRMNGVQLLRKIKDQSPHVQVLMMTAYSTIEVAIECLEAGATDYFLKPFRELAEIATNVQAACERVARWESATHSNAR